jgi:hypothetical protein
MLLKGKQKFQLNIIELKVYILKKARYKYAEKQKKKAKRSQKCIKTGALNNTKHVWLILQLQAGIYCKISYGTQTDHWRGEGGGTQTRATAQNTSSHSNRINKNTTHWRN